MITYCKRAFRSLAFFYHHYNDLDIYIEDKTCRNMYVILVGRMLAGKAKVSQVFPLGSRREVIDACEKDQCHPGRPRLYIIDGDFDSLLGRTSNPNLAHFYQLQVYCFENLLITEHAVCQVAFECLVDCSLEDVKSSLQYLEFLEEAVKQLKPLFAVYGAAHLLKPEIETTGYQVYGLLEDNDGSPTLSAKKIEQKIADIRTELHKSHPKDKVDSIIEQVMELLPNSPTDAAKFISGKTYILPLIYIRLQQQAQYRGKLRQLKVQLARHCELDIDPGLHVAVEKAASS